MKRKLRRKELCLTIFFAILCAAMIWPLILLISTSLSSEADIAKYGYPLLFPRKLDFAAYKVVFQNADEIIQAYKVTIFFSVVGTILSLFLMSMVAYALSRKDFKSKRFVSFYLYFTTLFSGGLVPSYILITQYLHLNDTIWVYIFPSLIAPFSIFMIRTNFQSLPYELSEAAYVDGANEYTVFFRVIVPLSKPVLATVALTSFLGRWQNWNTSMLYTNTRIDLQSLQYFLQKIMLNLELIQNSDFDLTGLGVVDVPTETVRMAMVVVVAGPALIIFPFFQKYFTKGMTVGSVKG